MDHESSVPRLHSDKSGQYLQFLIREILNCYDHKQIDRFLRQHPVLLSSPLVHHIASATLTFLWMTVGVFL